MAKRLLISLLVLVLLVLTTEGLASLALAWRDGGERTGIAEQSHCEYDPLLGWVNLKNFHAPDLYGPGRSLTTNERGFRSTKPVTDGVPYGLHRMVFLGDSFTLGHGVGDADTLPAWLERLNPEVQAINMGQGGYGVDQAILWYLRDGAALDANTVVLVFIAPDFDRITEARFQGQYPKPCLRVVDGELVPSEDPLPDEWSTASAETEGFLESLALTDLMRRLVRRNTPRPEPANELAYRAVAEQLLTDLHAAVQDRYVGIGGRRAPAYLHLAMIPLQDREAGQPQALLAWLRPFARSLKVDLVDLTEDFDELSPGMRAAYYAEDGHLNAAGNRFVAERLDERFGPHETSD